MGFLKRLAALFAATAPSPGNFYEVSVRCAQCGQVVTGRVNLSNDLSVEDAEGGEGAAPTLICRKVHIGSGRCFQPLEVRLRFDANRRLLDRQVTGGAFVE